MFKESPRLVTLETTEERQERGLLERRDALYAELIKLPAVAEAFSLLEELPPHLKYHTKEHTFGEQGVFAETILFALAEGVSENVIKQQVIAAAWHDVGFLKHVKGKVPEKDLEEVAIDSFSESEVCRLLDEKDREEIISNIKDTTMYFGSNGPYFEMRGSAFGYMLDADLSNFGREDFFDRMKEIAEETGVDLKDSASRAKFYKGVISLLENHDWHTEGARRLRERQKQKNLDTLKEEYNLLVSRVEDEYPMQKAA